ncbi:electron transport complex subunit RsxG [Thiomicrorhabdus aquaedulcis]|uniref:electron transport complex subunit RsxG n=1 Tax=Thiomicrorhabdus aquaedulcis TaxID=2211106 RepID=UPI001E4F819C|nr:electron transport complex subunit RsxG [Thiomicrorhabdus aquaedulcis]
MSKPTLNQDDQTSQANRSSAQFLVVSMARSAGKLTLFVVTSVVLLLLTRALTEPMIAEVQRNTLLSSFNQVLPAQQYDNALLEDTLLLDTPEQMAALGASSPVTVYRARKNNQPVGLILTTTAPNGYSGNITLLMAVLADGSVSGVRVLSHKETPGLGDKIELDKHDWILSFNGLTLTQDNVNTWAVKKDGGQFDQFTGATITPRAVVATVKQTLSWVNQQGAVLYE